jgi:hypothetical protein
MTTDENIEDRDREANFYLSAKVSIGENEVPRTFKATCKVPAGTPWAQTTQVVTAVDNERSDVVKYLQEYTTYLITRQNTILQLPSLRNSVTEKENAIKSKQQEWKNLLTYKQKLN